jgi:chromate transporter
VSTKEFLDGIAMGQVTPGPIMITATFLGYKLSGFLGAAMATLAIFSPAFFIVTLLIPHYDRLKGLKTVRIMEQGILAAFVGMLGLVLSNFGRTTFVDFPSVAFAATAFIALLKKVDLPYILLTGAALSILVFGLIL